MSIIEEYNQKKITYLDLKSKLELLIHSLIKLNSINIHQLTFRLKELDSLEKKIDRKGGKYSGLTDITDVLGCRIVTYFDDDVDKIAAIIDKEFLVDWDNSVDKRKLDFDKFGYLSLHYVVELKRDRLKLTEYKGFKNIKFEIQIRSILQHSWAEIEHDIGYKGEFSIPDNAKRSFSRIAALLELADQEFVRLKDVLNQYEKSVPEVVNLSPETSKINNATLTFLLKNNDIIKSLDAEIAKDLNIDLDFENDFISDLSAKLNNAGFNFVDEYITYAKENFKEIVEFSKKSFRAKQRKDREERGSGVVGISVFDLTAFKKMKDEEPK